MRAPPLSLLWVAFALFVASLLPLLLFPLVRTKADCTSATEQLIEYSIPSPGILCAECSLRGYLDPDTGACVCSSSEYSPALDCLKPGEGWEEGETPPYVDVDVLVTKVAVDCDCHMDAQQGYWKNVFPSKTDTTLLDPFSAPAHIYGHPFPSVCSECWSGLYGPLPGTVTASGKNFDVKACTTWGGPDPNRWFNSSSTAVGLDLGRDTDEWTPCGGHGDWADDHCECWEGWGLKEFPLHPTDAFGNSAPLCIKCAGPWGPPPPWERLDKVHAPPFCAYPWTPDPVTGVLSKCGGHGEYLLGECRCHSNSTHGYWKQSEFDFSETTLAFWGEGEYHNINVDYHVTTCGACDNPSASTSKGCLTPRTESPTQSP